MGMVGALSIVRFRTAVKDPLDTAYMFWALTMGILLGAGLYLIAVIVVLCIAILMFVISFAKLTTPNAYLLVVHYDEFCEAAIQSELNRSVRSSKLRSKTPHPCGRRDDLRGPYQRTQRGSHPHAGHRGRA